MVDLTVALLRHGYSAVERDRRARGGGTNYATRMLGRRAVVLGDEGGARLFYDEDVVERAGAVPPPLAWLLFGRGAVHGLDDQPHRERKELFLDTLGPASVRTCAEAVAAGLRAAAPGWAGREVDLHAELVRVYGAAVLDWVGADPGPAEAEQLGRRYAAIVDGFGFAGAAYLRAWAGRRRTDAWARRLVTDVRAGRRTARAGTVLEAIARTDLDAHTAAVELGNVVRPTIAVSWLGVAAFAALECLDEPQPWRLRLTHPADEQAAWALAQEVRRTAPFVPVLAGRVRRAATYDGLRLERGDRVVLDVRGIDLDPDRYPDPLAFRPERFLGVVPGPFELVPQGGGLPQGHRCPGESMTLQVLSATLRVAAGLDYGVTSSTRYDLRRIPTLPEHGLRIRV